MTKNLDNEGLSSIADNYQLFYIDLWGVVHNGVTLHLEAIKALKEINKKRKDYILLTNAPRPNYVVKSFLQKLGVDVLVLNLKVSSSIKCILKIYQFLLSLAL